MTELSPTRMVRLGPGDRLDMIRVDQAAFGWSPSGFDAAIDGVHLDWDRTWGAPRPAPAGQGQRTVEAGVSAEWGGEEELAGIYTVWTLQMALPGAGLEPVLRPFAGLSWVGVHPDHRRRGVASTMVRHHLTDLHDHGGEPVSMLWASEPSIYQRFGYGQACFALKPVIPRGAALRPGPPGAGRVATQLMELDVDRHVGVILDVQQRAAALRVGLIPDDEIPTRRRLTDRPMTHLGRENRRLLLAVMDGQPTGYAVAHRQIDWPEGNPSGRVEVEELYALDVASAYALWLRLLDIDLTSEVTTPPLAPDDPLVQWLVDARITRPVRGDCVWVRLVDLDRCVAARGYQADADVVLDVVDALCPWNARRWRFEARGGEGRLTASDAPADLRLDVRDLGAAYLGAGSLAAAGLAGLVTEHTPGALLMLSRSWRGAVDPAPPSSF